MKELKREESKAVKTEQVQIKPPNFGHAKFTIKGNAPLVINAFSKKAREQIHATQEQGSVARGKKIREAKNFRKSFEEARHISKDGWEGISASAFRSAFISACRLVQFKMTLAKLSIFIEADGYDSVDATPLVKITKGKGEYCEHAVRNENGSVDLRARAMYQPGWEAVLRIKWDADQFSIKDVANLLSRVGAQVGIGEGRADSKNSAGMGWGSFDISAGPGVPV